MDGDSERDEAIVSARIEGTSMRALAQRFGCSNREIEDAVDRRLNYELDNRQRVRLVKLSVERIVALMSSFYEKATKEKDVPAGTLCCKLEERLAMLLGLDAPTTQRLDVYQVEQQQKPSRHERIQEVFQRIADSAPPAQKALRKRLEELDPEEALRLLNAGNGAALAPPTAPSEDDENRPDPDPK